MVLDALLPVLGEITQQFQRLHTYGDVIPVCPDLHSNKHHTCMELLFEDLPSEAMNGSSKGKNTHNKTCEIEAESGSKGSGEQGGRM